MKNNQAERINSQEVDIDATLIVKGTKFDVLAILNSLCYQYGGRTKVYEFLNKFGMKKVVLV